MTRNLYRRGGLDFEYDEEYIIIKDGKEILICEKLQSAVLFVTEVPGCQVFIKRYPLPGQTLPEGLITRTRYFLPHEIGGGRFMPFLNSCLAAPASRPRMTGLV